MFRSILRLSVRSIFLAAFALLVPVVGSAQTSGPPVGTGTTPCPIASLAVYQATYGGNVGCTIGIATFYGFSTTLNAAGATDFLITPSAVPFGNSSQPLFTFTSSGGGATDPNDPFYNGRGNGQKNYNFEYYVDPPIDILGFTLADDPFSKGATQIEADLCIDAVFNANNNCRRGQGATLLINGVNQTQSATFPAGTRFIDVLTLVTIAQNDNIPTFTEAARVAAVPEPSQIGLTGIGALAMFGMLFVRRRARARI